MSGFLNRDAILGATSLRTEDVEVPEWGGTVRVAEMTGAARDAWEQSLVPTTRNGSANIANIRARLVAACVVDENGKRMFNDADAVALGEMSGMALDRVAKVAQRLNGLAAEDVEAAKGN
jgi:hypothetical protein